MQFITSLINLQKNASKEAFRHYITGVCVENHGEGIRLKATNGLALAEIILPKQDGLNLTKPFIVSPESIKMLNLFYKANKKSYFSFGGSSDEINIISNGQTIKLNQIYGDFPDTDGIKPVHKEVFKVGFNPKLLFDLCEALRASNRGNMAILEFDTTDKIAAVKVSFEGNSGLLMPMRIG